MQHLSQYKSLVPGVRFPDPKQVSIATSYDQELSLFNLPYRSVNKYSYKKRNETFSKNLDKTYLYSHRMYPQKNNGIAFNEYNGIGYKNRWEIESRDFVIEGTFPTNGNYLFLSDLLQYEYDGISSAYFYNTYSFAGKLLDMLTSYYSRLGSTFVESEIQPDLTVRKTIIQVDRVDFTLPTDTNEIDPLNPPIDDIDNYNDTIIGRRIDSYYQLTPDGKFELRRQLEFPRQEYSMKFIDSLYWERDKNKDELLLTLPQDSTHARWTVDMNRGYHHPGSRYNRSAANLIETGVSDEHIRFPRPKDILFDSLFTRRIGWAQLPFYADTASVPPSRWYRDSSTVALGRPEVDLSCFPRIITDDFGQAEKTAVADSLTTDFIRLDYLLPSNGNYLLVYGTYGTFREPWWGYYATFDTQTGKLIDHVLAKEWGMGMTTLESELSPELELRTTQIDLYAPYVFSTPGKPIRGQRTDRYYQLTSEGKFELKKEDQYPARKYDITELEHTRLYETKE